MIYFACPHCQAFHEASQAKAGTAIQCLECRRPFEVPLESTVEPPPRPKRPSPPGGQEVAPTKKAAVEARPHAASTAKSPREAPPWAHTLVTLGFVVIAALIGFALFGLFRDTWRLVDPRAPSGDQRADATATSSGETGLMSASELYAAYLADPAAADARFLNRDILFTGRVSKVQPADGQRYRVVLHFPRFNILCITREDLADQAAHLTAGQNLLIRGQCRGRENDVIVENCFIVQEK